MILHYTGKVPMYLSEEVELEVREAIRAEEDLNPISLLLTIGWTTFLKKELLVSHWY